MLRIVIPYSNQIYFRQHFMQLNKHLEKLYQTLTAEKN